MSQPRVLVVADGHPALTPNGGPSFAHDLFCGLRDDGTVEPVYLGCLGEAGRHPPRGAARLQRVGHAVDEALLWTGGIDRRMLATYDTEALRTLAEVVDHFQPHLVHVHDVSRIGLNMVAVIRRVVAGTPIVATLADDGLLCPSGQNLILAAGGLCPGPWEDGCRRCCPDAAAGELTAREIHLRNVVSLLLRVIVPSRGLAERLITWGVPRAKIRVIAPGWPDLAAQTDRTATPSPHSFGLFGPLTRRAGVMTALDAARRLAEAGTTCHLRLWGEIDEDDPGLARAFAEALGGASPVAVPAGPLMRNQRTAAFAKIAWVVAPALDYAPAAPAVMEAFHHGRPVIATRAEGITEIVRDGVNGLLVEPGDSTALASAIRRAATEPGLWDRLAAAIPPVPSFDDALDRHLALYHSLIAPLAAPSS